MRNGMYLAAAAISLSCSGSEPVPADFLDGASTDATEAVAADPDPVLDLNLSGAPAAPFDLPAPAPIARPLPVSIPITDHRTVVQLEPSFYPQCFSEDRATRLACHRRFNRRAPEAEILRRNPVPGLSDVTRLVLGRIILSEANWIHDDRLDHRADSRNHAERDAPAIYQVFRNTRQNGQTLLGIMRAHSPRISEARSITGRLLQRRMAWVVHLQLNCREPAGFPERAADGGRLDWTGRYRHRCLDLFSFAQRLLDGDAAALGGWTHAPLRTWGGRCEDAAGACDDHIAAHRGLVPFEMPSGLPTANRFWCRPGDAGCDGPPLVVMPSEPVQ